MVFTDQMIQPRRVIPVPKDLAPPRIHLSCEGENYDHELLPVLPLSPLGVWYIDGLGKFLEIVGEVLAYSSTNDTCGIYKDGDLYEKIAHLVQIGAIPGNFTNARGRRNLNLKAVPPIVGYDVQSSATVLEMDIVRLLQEQSANITKQVSRCMEIWLDLPEGSMQQAHERGLSSSLRLLDYPEGVSVPPHTDGSAYTLVYNKSSMLVQCPSNDDLWYELAPNQSSHSLLLLLGSHLDQAIPSRLEKIGRIDTGQCILRAPVHRLGKSNTPRRALTLHVKADIKWPSALENLNKSNHKKKVEGHLTAVDYHNRDISWDAELFSKYLFAKYVPSAENVRDHLKLLVSIVTGFDNSLNATVQQGATTCTTSDCVSSSSLFVGVDLQCFQNGNSFIYQLPSVHCTGYWQLQTERYCTFLKIHRLHPLKAAGMLPPRQIHHIWLCHQLHPLNYKTDCQAFLEGRILCHNNNEFCLQGCPKFHELWKAETGSHWPSQEELKQEVECAKNLKEVPSNDDWSQLISANLWHNYDGLSRLYHELKKETPCLFDFDSKYASSLINEARQDYARFLIASSYASTIGFMVTPSGLIDLVWHTHQTNPQSYDDTNQKEFPGGAINHVPCGALNPPPNNGKGWLEMTDKIWIDLYGHGVNVQGKAIHCCTPINPRPTGFILSENVQITWWFPKLNDVSSGEEFLRGFPSQRSMTTEIINLLSLANLNVDELLEHVFQPLSVAMKNTFQTYKDELIRPCPRCLRSPRCLSIARSCILTIMCLLPIIFFFFMVWSFYGGPEYFFSLFFVLLVYSILWWCFFFFDFHPIFYATFYWPKEKRFWNRINSLVESFNSRSMEHGMKIMLRNNMQGPVDPDHESNYRYMGKAIVFVPNIPPSV